MVAVVLGLTLAPFTASAWQDAEETLSMGGYLKDTLGLINEWYDPFSGSMHYELICPHSPQNTACKMFIPDQYCGIPDMPGYEGSDDDYYYFLAEEWDEDDYVNDDDGNDAIMKVPKTWLNSVWPPPGCE